MTTQAVIVLWKSVENSNNPADFQTYLDQYPRGAFTALAQRYLTAAKAQMQRDREAHGAELVRALWTGKEFEPKSKSYREWSLLVAFINETEFESRGFNPPTISSVTQDSRSRGYDNFVTMYFPQEQTNVYSGYFRARIWPKRRRSLPMHPQTKNITQMLGQLRAGNQDVVSELVPLLYEELRRLAAYYLRRERPNHTLQATALVNEAYLRLIDQQDVEWQNRSHFFGIAAQQMRRILVDYARSHHSAKRGGSAAKVSLQDAMVVSKENAADVLSIDQALSRLAAIDLQQARIVELRVFGGLTVEEVAGLLGVSAATVKRDWTMAKAWLTREMKRA